VAKPQSRRLVSAWRGCHDRCVTDTVEVERANEPTPRRSRKRMWIVLAAIAAVVAAGAVTATSISFHYLHARALSAGGSLGWLAPDNVRTKFVSAGPTNAMIIPARPGQWQTYSVQIFNNSDVTQTVLGLAPGGETAEPERITISTTSTALADESRVPYARPPVTLAPGEVRTLRLSHYSPGCWLWGHGDNRAESFGGLSLRVRVGAFTRTETLDFGDDVFELRGTGGVC
jgi:hypothetical protein